MRDKVPDVLASRLEASSDYQLFRRRVVLAKANGKWSLVCAAVEAIPVEADVPAKTPCYDYPDVLLYEDTLTPQECLQFATDLLNGQMRLGQILINGAINPQWAVELVPLSNDQMKAAGHVIEVSLTDRGNWPGGMLLLAHARPYYPNLDEALADWMPFPAHHGHSDGRNGHVVFLLPQTRAFLANVEYPSDGALRVAVKGSEARTLTLFVVGAYWVGKKIHHINATVTGGVAAFAVADNATRLEFYLIDERGTRYDFHHEDEFRHTGLGRARRGSRGQSVPDDVREACERGEGEQIEFKPFVPPDGSLQKPYKTKLHELVITVVALANTSGGRILLGVDDDCTVSGIDVDYAKWADKGLDPSGLESYLGALKSRLKSEVQGDIDLRIQAARLDAGHVVLIDVPSAASKPIQVRDDKYLYVRSGASNRKAAPAEWEAILMPTKPHSLW